MPWNCFRSSAKKKKKKKRKDKGGDSDHGEQQDQLLPSAEKHTIINAYSTGAENQKENDIDVKKKLAEKNGLKKPKNANKSVVIVESTSTKPIDVCSDAKTCNDTSKSSRKPNKKNKSKKCFANDKSAEKIAKDSHETYSSAPHTTNTPTTDIKSSSSNARVAVTAASELTTSNEADLATGCRSKSLNENAHESNLNRINDKNNVGNYDEIPFDLEKRNTGLNISPDDEPNPLHICEDKEGSPTSDGTVSSGYSSPSRTIPDEHIFEPTPNRSSTSSPSRQFSKSASHNFQIWTSNKGKHCQLCHDPFGDRAVALKCSHCDLTCHEWCKDLVPNVRYHDVSFVIFRKWLDSQEKYGFPTLYRYLYLKKSQESPSDDIHSLTDSECINLQNDVKKRSRTDRLTSQIDATTKNGQIQRRSRSHSLDTQRNRSSGDLSDKNVTENGNEAIDGGSYHECELIDLAKDAGGGGDDKINLRIIESDRNTTYSDRSSRSSQVQIINPTHIRVDVHRRPDSELLLIHENTDSIPNQNTKDNVPEISNENDGQSFGTNCGSRQQLDVRNGAMSRECGGTGDSGLPVELRRTKSHNDHSMEHEERQYTTMPKSQSFPVTYQYRRAPADSLRLHYVTQRILASVLPKRELNHQEINGDTKDKYEKDIISMLEQKHGKNYRIFDLESCISVITLERICELCKHIDSWLGDGQEKVVVLQDREDRQRLGTAIAAYLEYLDICSSNYTVQKNRNMNDDASIQSTIERNWLDLDIFSMKKFLEDFVGPLKVPSHRRYLRYFSGLLSGKIRMNSSPLYLKRVAIESPPTWMQYDSRLASQSPEWITFIKIYEGLRCIYTSDIHKIPMTTRQFLYEIGNLRLRGDIMIRCYQIVPSEKGGGFHQQETRELLYSLQFHTCALTENEIIYRRNDLDLACNDPRFPSDHKITLHVSNNQSDGSSVFFQSPLIRTTTPTDIARYDSLEFDLQSSCHTQGPIDGSLYATILKSPKSPQTQSYTIAKTSRQSVQQQQQDSTGQYLLSPPAQFSNQDLPVPPLRHNSVDRSTASSTFDIIERNVVSSIPTTGGVNTKDLHSAGAGQRSNSQTPNPYVVDTRPSTSQSNYSTAASQKYSVPVNYTPSETRNITIVETYNSSVDASSAGNPGYSQQVSRDYAPSPLTLSMDSGISSNGVLNRPHQGSSVSPSSFPSQASPQEDRHRELDDILSDMLMTVQDIPDFGKSSSSATPQPPQRHPPYHMVRSQSVIPTSGNYALPSQLQQPQSQYSTIRRSQSYVNEQPGGNHQHHPATYIPRDRQDFYDTSSTTTTLTPPPSESGRDTPVAIYSNSGNTSNYSTLQYHREKRETIAPTSHQHPQHQRQDQHQQQQQQLIMSVQRHQQSSLKPHQVRTEVTTVTTEEDEIPYHAREHSQPFSYGSVPSYTFRSETSSEDPAMIKAQSGLSSPSLVRKHLGRSPSPSSSSTAQRKTAHRVDFEEMLRDRREKVMNEKYSISDRGDLNNAPSAPRSYGSESQWSTSSTLNRYQSPYQQQDTYQHTSYEPIRRSNTMDGFHRSNSTDGISGQTWLQMQQQKLRAKKDQQHRDDRHYFEEVIHNEIRNRPLRNRANVARFDGYSSDTAAFADEVDYRRPLQIQTPYNRNRLPDDIYQSKTINTTTTMTKERPFVAVKRAHEQAKQQSATGSPPLSPLTVLHSSPNGHISHIQNQPHQQQQHSNGLLSMANNSPNGHVRLESETAKGLQTRSYSADSHKDPYNQTDNFSNRYVLTSAGNAHIKTNPNHQKPTIANDRRLDTFHENLNQVHATASKSWPQNRQFAFDLSPTVGTQTPILANNNNSKNTTNTTLDADGVELRSKSSSNGVYEQVLRNNDMRVPVQHKSYPIVSSDNRTKKNVNVNVNLADVIADLTEYTLSEGRTRPPNDINVNGYSDRINRNVHNANTIHELSNDFIITNGNTSSSISPAFSERSNTVFWPEFQVREESFSSYRSETDPEVSIAGSPRPETPAFPITPRTPYGLSSNGNVSPALPPKSPTSLRKDLYSGNQKGHLHEVVNQNDTISCYASRRNSNASNANSEPQEVAPHLVKFVRDSSKYWYKPNISREEAVALLRRAEPGTFIVRDSTTYKNAFGLVLRVAQPPPGVELRSATGDELVRHFLVEPTTRGVRLKGCNNEPVFSSLSALVYQHSIMPLALPCRLIIPDQDIQSQEMHSPAQRHLLALGAACNVLYLYTCETESLTGEEAIRKAVSQLFGYKPLPIPTEVHFKASQQGVTLTDNTRQKFFRKHYPGNSVSYCGLDPDKRTWSIPTPGSDVPVNNKTIFAFVARRTATSKDNQCHVFCDLQSNQPALAIVSFVNKVLPTDKQVNHHI